MPRKPEAVIQLDNYYNNCMLVGNVLEDDSILVDDFRMKKINGLWTLVDYYENVENTDIEGESGRAYYFDVPDYVEAIGGEAFNNTNFTCISISKNVTTIGKGAFASCKFLKEVYIKGNKLTEIQDYAFSGCEMLEDINIPEGVVLIGYDAFFACGKLKSIILPGSLKEIGDRAFLGCNDLVEVVIKSNMLISIPDFAFNRCRSLKQINIPEGVRKIGSYAFDRCESLESVKMPNTVVKICAGAFIRCHKLEDIRLSDNLRSIEDYSFESCRNLDIREIPASVTEIGIGVFLGTAIKKVTIYSGHITLLSAFEHTVQIYCPNYSRGCIVQIGQVCNKNSAMKQYSKNENLMSTLNN